MKSVFMGMIKWFWGEMDNLYMALIAVLIVEAITTVLRALVEHDAKTYINTKYISIRIMLFLVVGLGNIIGACMSQWGADALLRQSAILFYMAYEFKVFISNADAIGFPIPEIFTDFFDKLSKKDEASKKKED